MYCMNCGHPLSESERSCPSCKTIRGTMLQQAGSVKPGELLLLGRNEAGRHIMWQVLKVCDGKALIISYKNICKKKYNDEFVETTWEKCTLRSWLNGEFLAKTFSSKEKELIFSAYLRNDDNPDFGIPGGEPTTDNVFLLCIQEVNELFSGNVKSGNGSPWSLRSPGFHSEINVCCDSFGNCWNMESFVDSECGIRPALWIKSSI